jgi:hypothetical protein
MVLIKYPGGDVMANKMELKGELLLKERRAAFWEKHHRVMPKENELHYESVLDDPMAEFQDK